MFKVTRSDFVGFELRGTGVEGSFVFESGRRKAGVSGVVMVIGGSKVIAARTPMLEWEVGAEEREESERAQSATTREPVGPEPHHQKPL